jgi:hypothetical protein
LFQFRFGPDALRPEALSSFEPDGIVEHVGSSQFNGVLQFRQLFSLQAGSGKIYG